jgi:superfamily I DNA/RNA helicase
VPLARLTELGDAVTAGVPGSAVGNQSSALDSRVVVLSVVDAKGLEFDAVVVVDPAGILAESPRGASDLYVGLTRATQRLGVVHAGDLPEVLSRLKDAPVPA